MTVVTPRAGGPGSKPTKVKRLPPSAAARAIFNPLWPVAFGFGLMCASGDPVKNLWCGLLCFVLSGIMMILLRVS